MLGQMSSAWESSSTSCSADDALLIFMICHLCPGVCRIPRSARPPHRSSIRTSIRRLMPSASAQSKRIPPPASNRCGEFAAALEDFLSHGASGPACVDPDCVAFDFLPMGSSVFGTTRHQDQLYLDVGNQIAASIIDHHAAAGRPCSTTACLVEHPELVMAAPKPWRKPNAAFTIVVHEFPDLDSVSAAFLSMRLLSDNSLPEGATRLAEYVDAINAGSSGISPDNRYSLYAAYFLLAHRLSLRNWSNRNEHWRQLVREGLHAIDYVLAESIRANQPIDGVDAFAAPGLLGPLDRREVDADRERYERKLQSAMTQARCVAPALPGASGGLVETEMLFVEEVQNESDPDRCMFFKDWARTDLRRSPSGSGFTGLCIFTKVAFEDKRFCTISVRPDSGASLRGLAANLDELESIVRSSRYGVDDRKIDPTTRKPVPSRVGYANADPWYDGRSHRETIVNAPSRGTLLTVEQIESTILHFACSAKLIFGSLRETGHSEA